MKNKRKAALAEIVDRRAIDEKVIQKRPNTCVVIKTWVGPNEYTGTGFSKARWPDKWDSLHGITLARKKAIADVVRQVLRKEKDEEAVESASSAPSFRKSWAAICDAMESTRSLSENKEK